MATRQRLMGGGEGSGRGRPRLLMRTVFEDFQPQSEFKQEEGAHVLLLSLPGFNKEQIRVTIDRERSVVMIEGRRSLGGNKWSRFKKAFSIPPNSNPNQIHAKFQGGKLYVSIPTTITTTPPPPPQAHKPEHREEVPQRAPSPPKPARVEDVNEGTAVDADEENDAVQKGGSEGKDDEDKRDDGSSVPPSQGYLVMKDEYYVAAEAGAEAIAAEAVTTAAEAPATTTAAVDVPSGDRVVVEGYYKQVVRVVRDVASARGDDRRLLVNVGAAVFVIVAMGVYVSYGFWPCGKSKTT